jgi:hypothetical protein
MMRKLALTVFAMSLTLAGCGSSSSTKKTDAATDAVTVADTSKADVVVFGDTAPKTDTVVIGDAPAADVAVDAVVPTDVITPTDVTAADVTPSDARDGAVAETKPVDGKIDTTPVVKLDSGTDAPADTAPAGDAGGDAQAD